MGNLGLEPDIHSTALVRDCTFGRYTQVGARTQLAESTLGDYSYVVNDADIIYAEIGKFVSMAAHIRINPGQHPMHRASQAHFIYRASSYFDGEPDEAEYFVWRRQHRVTIGHDVWIGHGAIIMGGHTIGTGAVVGSGAIVTKDVAPYTIVVGNPARPVRRRFPEGIEARLLKLSWWDWDHERLRKALPDFRALSIEAFLEKHGD